MYLYCWNSRSETSVMIKEFRELSVELYKYVALLLSIDWWIRTAEQNSRGHQVHSVCLWSSTVADVRTLVLKAQREAEFLSLVFFFSILLKGFRTFLYFQLCYLPVWSLQFFLFSRENHHLEASTSVSLPPFTVRQEPALNTQDFYLCLLHVTKIRLKVLTSEICLVRITPEDLAWVKANCSKGLTAHWTFMDRKSCSWAQHL